MEKIFQLKIVLDGSKPKIWRRVLVEDTTTFDRMHNIIQKVMGWGNCHLHMFHVGVSEIGEPDPDYEGNIKDSKKIKLKDILILKQKFRYEYDFGDCWDHIITVEKILNKEDSKKYPVCIAGEMACPPDDSGGIWGYEELLEIMKNKSHPEHEHTVEWMGEDFNPEEFDIDKVNRRFK
ncbi:MAG: plasmid pRiA4b ORF-3 family protein [DPANN group archaeon]|nr:plasmid pRiA4b ORF-3 family protein [DPANN group archaeon]